MEGKKETKTPESKAEAAKEKGLPSQAKSSPTPGEIKEKLKPYWPNGGESFDDVLKNQHEPCEWKCPVFQQKFFEAPMSLYERTKRGEGSPIYEQLKGAYETNSGLLDALLMDSFSNEQWDLIFDQNSKLSPPLFPRLITLGGHVFAKLPSSQAQSKRTETEPNQNQKYVVDDAMYLLGVTKEEADRLFSTFSREHIRTTNDVSVDVNTLRSLRSFYFRERLDLFKILSILIDSSQQDEYREVGQQYAQASRKCVANLKQAGFFDSMINRFESLLSTNPFPKAEEALCCAKIQVRREHSFFDLKGHVNEAVIKEQASKLSQKFMEEHQRSCVEHIVREARELLILLLRFNFSCEEPDFDAVCKMAKVLLKHDLTIPFIRDLPSNSPIQSIARQCEHLHSLLLIQPMVSYSLNQHCSHEKMSSFLVACRDENKRNSFKTILHTLGGNSGGKLTPQDVIPTRRHQIVWFAWLTSCINFGWKITTDERSLLALVVDILVSGDTYLYTLSQDLQFSSQSPVPTSVDAKTWIYQSCFREAPSACFEEPLDISVEIFSVTDSNLCGVILLHLFLVTLKSFVDNIIDPRTEENPIVVANTVVVDIFSSLFASVCRQQPQICSRFWQASDEQHVQWIFFFARNMFPYKISPLFLLLSCTTSTPDNWMKISSILGHTRNEDGTIVENWFLLAVPSLYIDQNYLSIKSSSNVHVLRSIDAENLWSPRIQAGADVRHVDSIPEEKVELLQCFLQYSTWQALLSLIQNGPMIIEQRVISHTLDSHVQDLENLYLSISLLQSVLKIASDSSDSSSTQVLHDLVTEILPLLNHFKEQNMEGVIVEFYIADCLAELLRMFLTILQALQQRSQGDHRRDSNFVLQYLHLIATQSLYCINAIFSIFPEESLGIIASQCPNLHSIMSSFLEQRERMIGIYPFTKAALHLTLQIINEIQRSGAKSDMYTVFQRIDTDQTGTLSEAEFVEGLRKLGLHIPALQLGAIMRLLDRDGDGTINYEEFAQFMNVCMEQPDEALELLLASLPAHRRHSLDVWNSQDLRDLLEQLQMSLQHSMHPTGIRQEQEFLLLEEATNFAVNIMASYSAWQYTQRSERWKIGCLSFLLIRHILEEPNISKTNLQDIEMENDVQWDTAILSNIHSLSREMLMERILRERNLIQPLLSAIGSLPTTALAHDPTQHVNAAMDPPPISFEYGILASLTQYEALLLERCTAEAMHLLKVVLLYRLNEESQTILRPVVEVVSSPHGSRTLRLSLYKFSQSDLVDLKVALLDTYLPVPQNWHHFTIPFRNVRPSTQTASHVTLVLGVSLFVHYPQQRTYMRDYLPYLAVQLLSLICQCLSTSNLESTVITEEASIDTSADTFGRNIRPKYIRWSLLSYLDRRKDSLRGALLQLLSYQTHREPVRVCVLQLIETALRTQPAFARLLLYPSQHNSVKDEKIENKEKESCSKGSQSTDSKGEYSNLESDTISSPCGLLEVFNIIKRSQSMMIDKPELLSTALAVILSIWKSAQYRKNTAIMTSLRNKPFFWKFLSQPLYQDMRITEERDEGESKRNSFQEKTHHTAHIWQNMSNDRWRQTAVVRKECYRLIALSLILKILTVELFDFYRTGGLEYLSQQSVDRTDSIDEDDSKSVLSSSRTASAINRITMSKHKMTGNVRDFLKGIKWVVDNLNEENRFSALANQLTACSFSQVWRLEVDHLAALGHIEIDSFRVLPSAVSTSREFGTNFVFNAVMLSRVTRITSEIIAEETSRDDIEDWRQLNANRSDAMQKMAQVSHSRLWLSVMALNNHCSLVDAQNMACESYRDFLNVLLYPPPAKDQRVHKVLPYHTVEDMISVFSKKLAGSKESIIECRFMANIAEMLMATVNSFVVEYAQTIQCNSVHLSRNSVLDHYTMVCNMLTSILPLIKSAMLELPQDTAVILDLSTSVATQSPTQNAHQKKYTILTRICLSLVVSVFLLLRSSFLSKDIKPTTDQEQQLQFMLHDIIELSARAIKPTYTQIISGKQPENLSRSMNSQSSLGALKLSGYQTPVPAFHSTSNPTSSFMLNSSSIAGRTIRWMNKQKMEQKSVYSSAYYSTNRINKSRMTDPPQHSVQDSFFLSSLDNHTSMAASVLSSSAKIPINIQQSDEELLFSAITVLLAAATDNPACSPSSLCALETHDVVRLALQAFNTTCNSVALTLHRYMESLSSLGKDLQHLGISKSDMEQEGQLQGSIHTKQTQFGWSNPLRSKDKDVASIGMQSLANTTNKSTQFTKFALDQPKLSTLPAGKMNSQAYSQAPSQLLPDNLPHMPRVQALVQLLIVLCRKPNFTDRLVSMGLLRSLTSNNFLNHYRRFVQEQYRVDNSIRTPTVSRGSQSAKTEKYDNQNMNAVLADYGYDSRNNRSCIHSLWCNVIELASALLVSAKQRRLRSESTGVFGDQDHSRLLSSNALALSRSALSRSTPSNSHCFLGSSLPMGSRPIADLQHYEDEVVKQAAGFVCHFYDSIMLALLPQPLTIARLEEQHAVLFLILQLFQRPHIVRTCMNDIAQSIKSSLSHLLKAHTNLLQFSNLVSHAKPVSNEEKSNESRTRVQKRTKRSKDKIRAILGIRSLYKEGNPKEEKDIGSPQSPKLCDQSSDSISEYKLQLSPSHSFESIARKWQDAAESQPYLRSLPAHAPAEVERHQNSFYFLVEHHIATSLVQILAIARTLTPISLENTDLSQSIESFFDPTTTLASSAFSLAWPAKCLITTIELLNLLPDDLESKVDFCEAVMSTKVKTEEQFVILCQLREMILEIIVTTLTIYKHHFGSLSIPGILSSDLLAHLDRFISNPKYKSVAGDTVMFYNSICLFVEEHTGKGSRLISHSPKSPLINSRNNQRRKVHSYKTTHINSPIQSSQRLTESSLKLLGSPRNKKSGMNSP